MAEAAFWGLVGGGALVIGALLGLLVPISRKLIGLIMAFGSGVLIAALSVELSLEAFELGGRDKLALGLVTGALCFYIGDVLVDRAGGDARSRPDGSQSEGVALAMVLGAVLDGIPESTAIGVSVVGGGEVSTAIVVAVFLSNIPEGMATAVGLRKAGRSNGYVLRLWALVALVSATAAALGYGLLGDAGGETLAFVKSFAAGAILAMLSDTMIPEAYKSGGRLVGVVSALGFALAFLLAQAS